MDCQILEVNISLSRASGRAKMNLWKAVIEYSSLNQRRMLDCQILEVNISLSRASGRAKMNLWKAVINIHILNQRRMMDCQILEVNICLSRASGRAKMNLWKVVIEYSYLIWKTNDETVRFSRSIFAFPELQEELKWTSEK